MASQLILFYFILLGEPRGPSKLSSQSFWQRIHLGRGTESVSMMTLNLAVWLAVWLSWLYVCVVISLSGLLGVYLPVQLSVRCPDNLVAVFIAFSPPLLHEKLSLLWLRWQPPFFMEKKVTSSKKSVVNVHLLVENHPSVQSYMDLNNTFEERNSHYVL